MTHNEAIETAQLAEFCAVQADQRRIYKGRARHECPTCHEPNAINDEQKRRGYHCNACTRATEEGY